MIAPYTLLTLVACGLWSLVLVEAKHYKFIWKPQNAYDPIKTITKFVVIFKRGDGELEHTLFAANKGKDNNVFELREDQYPGNASLVRIGACTLGDNIKVELEGQPIEGEPNEEGITVIELFCEGPFARQGKPWGGFPHFAWQTQDFNSMRRVLELDEICKSGHAHTA